MNNDIKKELYAKINEYNCNISTKNKQIVINSATLVALTVVAIMSMNGIDTSSFENVVLRIIPEIICSIPFTLQLTYAVAKKETLIIEKRDLINELYSNINNNNYSNENTKSNVEVKNNFISKGIAPIDRAYEESSSVAYARRRTK